MFKQFTVRGAQVTVHTLGWAFSVYVNRSPYVTRWLGFTPSWFREGYAGLQQWVGTSHGLGIRSWFVGPFHVGVCDVVSGRELRTASERW